MILPKAIQMVSLFLKFLALEIRKIINIVYIVKAIPVRMVVKLSGIELFQQSAFRFQHTGKAAGNAPGLGIVDHRIQGGLLVTFSYGEQIDTFAVKLGEKYIMSLHKGLFLPSPKVKIHKTVFTAPLTGCQPQTVIGCFICRVKGMKIDHGAITSLFLFP